MTEKTPLYIEIEAQLFNTANKIVNTSWFQFKERAHLIKRYRNLLSIFIEIEKY